MEVRKIKEISSTDIYENPSECRGRKIKINTWHCVVLKIGQDVVGIAASWSSSRF